MYTEKRNGNTGEHREPSPVFLAALIVCLAVSVFVAVIMPHEGSKRYAYVTFTENEYHNKTSNFISTADDERLYLYYEADGAVNIYSREGSFLYCILVGHIQNGKGAIAIVDGLLYIKARGNIIYILDGENIIDIAVFSKEEWKKGDTRYTDYEAKMLQANH